MCSLYRYEFGCGVLIFLQGILMCLVSYFEFLFYELEMELLSDLKLSYIEVVCYKVVNFKEFVQDDDVKF